jgi:hypothetical protein
MRAGESSERLISLDKATSPLSGRAVRSSAPPCQARPSPVPHTQGSFARIGKRAFRNKTALPTEQPDWRLGKEVASTRLAYSLPGSNNR